MRKLLLVIKMIINNRLKYCREEQELTQKELGIIFGVHEATISGWENAHDNIPLKKLVKFCNMYNYSLDYVLGLSDHNSFYENSKVDIKLISTNLKMIRKELKFTQIKMAEILEISQARYCNYENEKFLPTTDILYTLAKNLKLSVDKIIGRKEKRV